MAYNANKLYPHEAQVLNDFNSSAVSKKGILACHGYSYEEYPDAFEMHLFTDRANSLGTGITFSLGLTLFDLTSLQDAAEQLHYPEVSGERLRLEMFFQFPLEQVTEVIVWRERL